MAIVKTLRLNLAKQAAGDPNWDIGTDTGFDDADLRLLKVSSDFAAAPDPNSFSGDGDFVGQHYIDETVNPPRLWICTTVGTPGVWRLISADGVQSPVAIGGNTILDDILVDHETRVVANAAAIVANTALITLPKNYLGGGGLANTSTTRVTRAAVEARCGSGGVHNTRDYKDASTFAKDLVSGWVAGTTNAGLPTAAGAVTADTWYAVFLVTGTNDVSEMGYDVDGNGVNLIADAAVIAAVTASPVVRRIGWVYTDASILIRPYIQRGNYFLWDTIPTDPADWDADSTADHRAPGTLLTVKAPPFTHCALRYIAGDLGARHSFMSDLTSITNGTGTADAFPGSNGGVREMTDVLLNASSQFRYIVGSEDGSSRLECSAESWIDTRGRDDD